MYACTFTHGRVWTWFFLTKNHMSQTRHLAMYVHTLGKDDAILHDQRKYKCGEL